MHEHCLQFLLEVKMAPRETENNAYAKFWSEQQRVLWYVMVFSGVANNKVITYGVEERMEKVEKHLDRKQEGSSLLLLHQRISVR